MFFLRHFTEIWRCHGFSCCLCKWHIYLILCWFSFYFEWSQQMMRGSWLKLKSQVTETFVTKSNSSEEPIVTLASTVTKEASVSPWRHFPRGGVELGSNDLFDTWKGFYLPVIVKFWIWWAELYTPLDWIDAICALEVGLQNCPFWLGQKHPVQPRAKTSHLCCEDSVFSNQSLSGKNSCFWLEIGRAWNPSVLETLLTSSKYFTFSIVKQWYHFWVLTAKQVGISTLSSRALAAMLGH